MNMVTARKTWTTTKKNDIEKGYDVLPTKWVFTYKTDSDGYIQGFKARLVVRGDLQTSYIAKADLYAHTAAMAISVSWPRLLQKTVRLSVDWTPSMPSCSHISRMTKFSTSEPLQDSLPRQGCSIVYVVPSTACVSRHASRMRPVVNPYEES
jgi:hypothetical protein